MNVRSKQPPRGFVSLEAAAEILWQDESDPDVTWGIAFLRIVADTQGFTFDGKTANVRLDAWQADVNSPVLVRARQVPPLWPAFRWWCRLPIATDDAKVGQRRRGRPEGSTIAGDEFLLERAKDLLRAGQAKSPTDAARIVSVRALGGGTLDSKFHRIRKKLLADLKRQEAGNN